MTEEEILAMQPGEQLNVIVATEVMGHAIAKEELFGMMERLIDPADGNSVWGPVHAYSEDMSIAEAIVERMLELGYEDAIYWADFGDGSYTEPEAICKVALLAILEGCLTNEASHEVSDKILRQALGDDEGK